MLRQRLAAARAWLSAGSGEGYVLQLPLMMIDNPAQVERVLQRWNGKLDMAKLYVYPTRIGTSARYAIVYGNFDSQAQAKAASGALDTMLGQRAQLRTRTGILSEIARSHADDLWPK